METEHVVKKRSRLTTAAIVMAVGLVPYYLVALILLAVLDPLFAPCNREDFGACALQNLFMPFVEIIVGMVILIAIPLVIAMLSTIFAIVGHSKNKAQKRSGSS